MTDRISLILFLVLVVGGGLAIGAATVPGDWFAGLQKPAFNPPGWVFGPVWTLLYVLIAIVGWRCWRQARTGWSMTLWWLQLGLNFLWSPVFFAAQQIGLALAVILALLATLIAFVLRSWPRDRWSAALILPYLAWVTFASALNAAIWYLN